MFTTLTRRSFLASSAAVALSPRLMAGVKPGRPMKLPLKVGQIGVAHSHAAGKWQTINQFPELFDVIGLAEPDEALRRKTIDRDTAYRNANWIGQDEILEQASLVVVETGIPDLVPTARRAVAAGKHIHLDKPGGTNLADFTALLKEAEQQAVVVQMGYMFRYNPAFRFLFDAVNQGWLGQVREINAAIGKRADHQLRLEIGRYSGGGMFELGCHLVDATVTLLGPPTKVHAFNRATGDDGLADNQLAVLEYPGTTAAIRCNHVDPFGGPRRQFSVIGDAGSIEIRPLEPPKLVLMIDRPRGDYKKGAHEIDFPRGGRYDGDFQDLAAVLSGAKDFDWDYAHDLAVQRAVLEASGMKLRD